MLFEGIKDPMCCLCVSLAYIRLCSLLNHSGLHGCMVLSAGAVRFSDLHGCMVLSVSVGTDLSAIGHSILHIMFTASLHFCTCLDTVQLMLMPLVHGWTRAKSPSD